MSDAFEARASMMLLAESPSSPMPMSAVAARASMIEKPAVRLADRRLPEYIHVHRFRLPVQEERDAHALKHHAAAVEGRSRCDGADRHARRELAAVLDHPRQAV